MDLVENSLKMTWDDIAEKLGYTTSSTLRQARNGETLISVEKLSELAKIRTADGRKRVSVDWFLTGSGSPLIDVDGASLEPHPTDLSVAVRVAQAPLSVQRKIEAFLDIQGIVAPDETGSD